MKKAAMVTASLISYDVGAIKALILSEESLRSVPKLRKSRSKKKP